MDRERLAQDARYVLETQEGSVAARVAQALLTAIVDPAKLLPPGHAIVRQPELLKKGIPEGEY